MLYSTDYAVVSMHVEGGFGGGKKKKVGEYGKNQECYAAIVRNTSDCVIGAGHAKLNRIRLNHEELKAGRSCWLCIWACWSAARRHQALAVKPRYGG